MIKQIFYALIIIAIIIGGPILIAHATFYKINPLAADYDFCEDRGYNYDVDYGGHYTEYKDKDYGRVICYYCYVEGCEKETFNVTRDWRGELIRHDLIGGKTEQ